MANATAGSVIILDTNGQVFDGKRIWISAIKYIGATGGTATLKAGGSSGTTVWEEAGTSNVFNGECEMYVDDAYITLAGTGTKVYIYLCAE